MTSPNAAGSDAQLELSLSGFLDAVTRRWRFVAACGLLAAAGTAAITLVLPRKYTVRAAITPVGPKTPGGGLSGLAAAAGLSLGAGSTLAPEYYTEIAGSDDLLRRVLEAPATEGDSAKDAASLAARVLGEAPEAEGALQVRRAIPEVREMLGTRISQKSGIVTLSITSTDADLSMRVILEVIRQLDAVNRVARTARNEAEFRFLESRLGETRLALDKAEDELERFLARNRAFNSPSVELEQQRISRTMELARATYISVANAYDEARLEMFRDTPTLSVIGAPRPPLGPDPRGLVTRSIFAGAAFTALAILLLFLHEWAVALWPGRAPFASLASGVVRRA
jgi:uncharacterized protein involved in exopolysaccharide biosynthesis